MVLVHEGDSTVEREQSRQSCTQTRADLWHKQRLIYLTDVILARERANNNLCSAFPVVIKEY